MTPAERQELKQRRALKAQQPAQSAQQPSMSGGDLALSGIETAGQQMSMGFGDEIGAGINAGIDQLGQTLGIDLGQGQSGNETLSQSYNRRLGSAKGRQANLQENYPEVYYPSAIGGALTLGGRGTAINAALGGLEGFGSGDGMQDRFERGAIGTALGGTAAKLGDVIGSVFSKPSMSQRVVDGIGEIAQRAEARAGKRLITKATRLDSESGKTLENTLEKLPIAGEPTRRIKRNLADELNASAARSIGAPEGKLTEDVLGNTLDNIVSDLTTPTAGKMLEVGDDSVDAIQSIVDQTKRLPSRPAKAISFGDNLVEELKSGTLTGERYKELSEDVRGLAWSMRNSPDSVSIAPLHKMDEALDDIVEKTLGGQSLIDYKDARKRYGAFKALTKGTNTVNPTTGDVNGKLLFNELAKGGKGYKVSGELGDLARLSKAPDIVGSNTTEKLLPYIGGAALLTTAGAGGADVSGTALGAILGSRVLNEAAQRGVPGVTGAGAGMLGGAIQRSQE